MFDLDTVQLGLLRVFFEMRDNFDPLLMSVNLLTVLHEFFDHIPPYSLHLPSNQ
jgi:hypothetical protein